MVHSLTFISMFFQLLYIHLFRPFLKYNQNTTPLPANVSPRKICTQAAAMISKLFRLYKRSHGLRQICNIAVYIAHSACTIHLLNIPDKIARRDIVHGVKHLEEIAEGWLCARRALGILSVLAKKWNVVLPEEAAAVLDRSEQKFGPFRDVATPKSTNASLPGPTQQFSNLTSSPPAVYSVPISTTSPNFFTNINSMPVTTTNPNAAYFATSSARPSRRLSDNHSLPPHTAADFALPRAQRQQFVSQSAGNTPPASAVAQSRNSLDSNNTTGASPSEFWNGADQITKDGQDWWIRDQSQLASNWNSGFENWNLADADMSWLNTNNGNGSGTGGAVMSSGNANGMQPSANGSGRPAPAPAPLRTNTNGNANGNGTFSNDTTGNNSPVLYGAGLASLTGGLNALSTYNEEEWYQ